MEETIGQADKEQLITFSDEMREVIMQLAKQFLVKSVIAYVEGGKVVVEVKVTNFWFKKLFAKSYLTFLQDMSDKICGEKKITVILA